MAASKKGPASAAPESTETDASADAPTVPETAAPDAALDAANAGAPPDAAPPAPASTGSKLVAVENIACSVDGRHVLVMAGKEFPGEPLGLDDLLQRGLAKRVD